MKYKAIYALLALSLLAGCVIPQNPVFAEGYETIQDEETGETDQTTDETDQPTDGSDDTSDTEEPDEDPFNDPGNASDGLGSGNNGSTTTTPDQPQTPSVTVIPGEVVTSDPNKNSSPATSPSETTPSQQIHVSSTAYSADDETEISAVDEYVETNLDGPMNNSEDVEVPNTGEEDGINMLAVGLLAIAGITIMAAAAIVILMNRLAKRAESELD